MRRILFDTNIYGLIAERKEGEEIKELVKNSNAIIYGCFVIRKELRDVPKNHITLTESGIRNLRIFLLNLYDSITKNHEIKVDEKTTNLANKYLQRFSELTGQIVINHLKNDFTLVACASINKLDFITSEDHKTLFSQEAVRAYQFVNLNEGLTQPPVITYEELKKFLKRWSPL